MATEIKAANGSAARANGDVTITFNINYATIKQNSSDQTTPKIYIPITNPVSTSYKVSNVRVDFVGNCTTSGSESGAVTDMWVYFGNTQVYHAAQSWTKTQTFDTDITGDLRIADADSYGVLVTLALSLPNTDSYIHLYSVDVTFKNISSSS